MGGYANPADAERASPYADPQQAATAAEAEAAAGQQVEFRGTYGGANGRAAQNAQLIQMQQAQQAEAQQYRQGARDISDNGGQGFQHTMAYNQANGLNGPGLVSERDYAAEALTAAHNRPGYTDESTLGNSTTQGARRGIELLRTLGFDVASPDAITGKVLEYQREASYAKVGSNFGDIKTDSPWTSEQRFYTNELQKWMENPVEESAAYHNLGRENGVQMPANPFEYRGDLALEALKGSPNKPSEFFSPVSGQMREVLPNNGMGLQQDAWNRAVAFDRNEQQPGRVSFANAVQVINNAEGLYGPYGYLYGGKVDTRSAFAGIGDVHEQHAQESINTFNGMSVVSLEIGNHNLNPNPGGVVYSVQSTPSSPSVENLFANTASGVLNMFGFNLPTNRGFASETITETRTRAVNPNNIMSGSPAATWMFIGTDNRATSVMDFKSGSPYMKDGSEYQNYEHHDLTRMVLTETTTTVRTEPSVYDQFNSQISSVIPKVPESMQAGARNDYIANFFVQGYEAAAEHPLDIAKNASLGVILIGGGEIVGGGITALATGTRFAGVINAAGTIAPWVLGGLYGESVAARSTVGFSDWTPAAAGRFGGILSTETLPLVAGGMFYANAPEISARSRTVYESMPSMNNIYNGLADRVFAFRQRLAGIENVGRNSGLDYYTEEPWAMQQGLPNLQRGLPDLTSTSGYRPATEFRYTMLETNAPAQMLLPEVPQSLAPKQVPLDVLLRDVFPREAPLWRKMNLQNTRWVPETKEAAMNYIKDRYPDQEEIWPDYMTQTQELHPEITRTRVEERNPLNPVRIFADFEPRNLNLNIRTAPEESPLVNVLPKSEFDSRFNTNMLTGKAGAITLADNSIFIREGSEGFALHEILHTKGFRADKGGSDFINEGVTELAARKLGGIPSGYTEEVSFVKNKLIPATGLPEDVFFGEYAKAQNKSRFLSDAIWDKHKSIFADETDWGINTRSNLETDLMNNIGTSVYLDEISSHLGTSKSLWASSAPYWETPSPLEEQSLAERNFGRDISQKKNRDAYPVPFVGFGGEVSPNRNTDRMISPFVAALPDITPETKTDRQLWPEPFVSPKTEPRPISDTLFETSPWGNIPPPVIPGVPLLFGGVGGWGGKGSGGENPKGRRKKNYRNPVVDIDYLSHLSGSFPKPVRLKNLKI